MHAHRMNTDVKRCRLNSLSMKSRKEIGLHEHDVLRCLYNVGTINASTYVARRDLIDLFIRNLTNTINSDGVLVEFFVGSEDG